MIVSDSVIFLGDTHGFIDDFKKQKEIIEEIKPRFVLYERLENFSLISKEDYLNIFLNKKISNMTSFGEVEKLIRFCFDKRIKLIGIDFKNFGLDKNLQEKVKKQEDSLDEEVFDKILEKRGKNHVRIIKKYLNETNKPILVIVGSWHLREDSLLMKSFKNCRVIIPCNREGKFLIEPPEDEEVFYCER